MKGKKRKKGRIAIVGMSCWYPGSQSLNEFWENILARRQQFRRMRDERLPISQYHDNDRNAVDKTYGTEAAVIDGFEFDWQQKRIPKRTYDSTDIVHWLALEVAQKALLDSGIPLSSLQGVQAGVVLGNTLTGEWTRTNAMRMRWPFVEKVLRANSEKYGIEGNKLEDFVASVGSSFKSVFPEITEDTLAGGLSNTIAGRICNVLDLHGGGYTVDGACSSSLLAVINAARSLVQGDMDVAFAGGIDVSLDTFELIGFAKTGALTTDEMRVYDKRANGFIPGEGCGFVVLKRLVDAERDGDKIYAVINGWGLSSDGKGGLTAPSIDGQARAISKAYQMAGYPLAEVNFVEGHGTGTTLGDKVEISALVKVLGDQFPASPIGMTSLKSIVGHTKAAAGIGGLIKAAIGVNQRIVPPMAGIEDPNILFSNEARHFHPVVDGQRLDPQLIIKAGVSAMGFGGINTHVTLESYGHPQDQLRPSLDEDVLLQTTDSCEILVYSANSQTTLRRQIEAAVDEVRQLSRAELGDYARHLAYLTKQHETYRAAVVVRRPEQAFKALTSLISLCTVGLKDGEIRTSNQDGATLYLGHAQSAPKIALMFPGQGAQKLQMARKLVRRYQWARDMVDVADQIFTQYGKESLLSILISDETAAEAKMNRTEITQPAVTLANTLWFEALKRYGISGQLYAGHSLGELTAFYAAGAFDFPTLMRLACERGKLMSGNENSPGAMAFVKCDEQRCNDILSGIDGYVAIANVNEPNQTVIGGDEAAVKKAVENALGLQIHAGLLNVSNAFHTKYMDHAATKFGTFVASLNLKADEKTGINNVYSGIDGEAVGDVSMSEYFASQLRAKVQFIKLVKEVAARVDVMIEVGPSQILSSLISKICTDDGPQCLPVESRPGADKDLKMVLANIYVRGGQVRWDEVYRDRFFNAYQSANRKVFVDNPVERPLQVVSANGGKAEHVAKPPVVAAEASAPVSTVTVASPANIVPTPAVAAAGDTKGSPTLVIYQVVSDLTGFETGSLQPELRLLDDLNLDSIKVTELIYRISSHFNVSEQLETSAYTNATIAELADAIAANMPVDVSAVAAATGTSAITEPAPSVPVKKPAEPTTSASSSSRPGWVRNFKESMEISPLVSDDSYNWREKRVTVIGHESDFSLLKETAAALAASGADVAVVSKSEDLKNADLSTRQVTVTVLPSAATSHREVVELLASVVRARFNRGHSLVFVQIDDGNFGKSASAQRLYSGKSFAASIGYERPDINVCAVSLPDELAQGKTLVHIIGEELTDKSLGCAVGYDRNGVRHKPILVADEPVEYAERGVVIGKEDVIVVTGGAKGITRACAEVLAETYHSRFAIIGSSLWTAEDEANPDHPITQAMMEFRKYSAHAQYFSCDLAKSDAVSSVIERINNEIGVPTVLIHGAGLNTPKPAANVEAAEALREMAPKLVGIDNLLAEMNSESLKFIGALTSVIGVAGMPGNAWYAFANETLDLVLRRYSGKTGVPVCTFAYSVWSEIGMGARMGSDKYLEQKGIGAVSPEEGVARFMHLIKHRAEDQQTVIASRLGVINGVKGAAKISYAIDFTSDVRMLQPGVEAVARVRLTHKDHPYLLDHNYKGSYLFPTVFGLEAMAQVANLVTDVDDCALINIEEIKLTRPIMVGNDGLDIEIWAELEEKAEKNAPVRIRCGIRTALTGYKIDHFSAEYLLTEESISPLLTFPNMAGERGDLGIIPKRDLYDSVLFQGPMFQRLETIKHLESDNETEGRTLFTSGVDEKLASLYLLGDPYFRDSLLQSAQIIIPQNQCLPIEIKRIRVVPNATTKIERLCFTDVFKSDDKTYLATIEVRDETGAVVERLENYQLRFLEKRMHLPKAMDLIRNVPTSVTENPLLAPYKPVADLLRIDAEPNGPQNQAVFVHRFIPDFKTFSNLSRSIHFSHIFNWMGWAREMSSIPVLDRIRTLTETGKYGLVTNWASIEVLGDCRNQHRVVEARMWCGKMTGQKNSSAVLTFDWVSRGEAGIEERIAVGRMGFTWVEIVGHGVVRPVEFPGYYQEFIENMVAKNDEPDIFIPTAEPYRVLDPGAQEFSAPSGPGPGCSIPLCSKFFETSLYDANLVGNLYFGNYSIWMGKLRDEFFFSLAPGLYRGIGEFGELTCVNSRIQHLREAMPFDDIYVTMGMTRLSTNSVDLHFEFYKVDQSGSREKLAVATHRVIWTVVGEDSVRRSAPLPPAIFQRLMAKTDNTISIAAAS